MSNAPNNENGGPVSRTAATETPTAKSADTTSESVKVAQLARWLDEAIAMCRRAATDPVEFQRLGLLLQQMRGAVG